MHGLDKLKIILYNKFIYSAFIRNCVLCVYAFHYSQWCIKHTSDMQFDVL
jgi:hypothetical protein